MIGLAARLGSATPRKHPMALHEKLKALAAAAKKLPADIEAQADKLAARIAAVDTRAVNSFGKLGEVVTDAEGAVAATEDAVNQITNGAPK